MKVATILMVCLIIMSNLPSMKSEEECIKEIPMQNCESKHCADVCLDTFGPNIYYFICGCSSSVKDTCLCKMPC
ncbi:hypothetical protein ABFS82_02G068600 [Erythranthe guttata]